MLRRLRTSASAARGLREQIEPRRFDADETLTRLIFKHECRLGRALRAPAIGVVAFPTLALIAIIKRLTQIAPDMPIPSLTAAGQY
jgi:hypothetical protein